MKKLIFSSFFLLIFFAASAQQAKPSPAAQAQAEIGSNTVTIDYHAPSVKGREIWGALVPYGKVWRAGANASTSFAISADAKVNGKKLPKGKYAFFVIPHEKEWTIILNKTIKWGAFSYKKEEDVLRFSVPVTYLEDSSEKLSYEVSETGEVSLRWEHAKVSFPVKF